MPYRFLFLVISVFAASILTLPAQMMQVHAQTLSHVKEKGAIVCGVSQGLPGFSNPDDKGNWSGIDVDLCRAVSAAIFGTPDNVKFLPLSSKVRFTALQSGEIDLLARNTTWTMRRDISLGVTFTGVNYYDGQGFMVREDLGVTRLADLDGASLCTNAGTTTELNIADYFRSRGMAYEINTFEKADESVAAYDAGRCDAYTTDQSALYAQRLKLKDPSAHIVLPEIISKEPLAPVVRQGDDQWADLVSWVHYAMLIAEEHGIKQANVDSFANSKNPTIRRLLGTDGTFGESLGVSNEWAGHIIRAVGNYGEVFERNLGQSSTLKISRGINALWTRGGLQYAPPIR